MKQILETDYLVVGAGIMGLTIAHELIQKYPDRKIIIIDKEKEIAQHASGRNSGVLHAGFYYDSSSLKAKFCVEGNKLMTKFCMDNDLSINKCGKLVVAKNEDELSRLEILYKRGLANGATLDLIDEKKVNEIDENAITYKKAIWSPSTSSVNPRSVCRMIEKILIEKKVSIIKNTKYIKRQNNQIQTNAQIIKFNFLINTAGLYADKIAKDWDIGKDYKLIPFKGIYLKSQEANTFHKVHIYPVPHPSNAFLGVHYTLTDSGYLKIGPTAIPAFWRENYKGFTRFSLGEFLEVSYWYLRLFIKSSFNFRKLVFQEMPKYLKFNLRNSVKHFSKQSDLGQFKNFAPAGIRAQLIKKSDMSLVTDFLYEKTENSLHVLNAVSPAFTCSFAMAKKIVSEI